MTKRFRKLASYSALAFAFAVVAQCPAAAQTDDLGPFLGSAIPLDDDRGRNISVVQRPRPEYDPLGINLGGFTAFPFVEIGLGYSDNVFASSVRHRGDAYLALDPQLKLSSNWATNSLVVSGGAALRRFVSTPIKNETGYYARADGTFEVDRDTLLVGAAEVRRAYQAQFSSSAPDNALRSVSYVQSTGLVRGSRQFGRLKATLAVDVTRANFSDLPLASGVTIDQDFRDVTVLRGGGRVAYAITPGASVFAEANYSTIAHDLKTVGFGRPNRDGTQIYFLGGASFDVSALIRAHAGIGYTRRTFDAGGTYRPISGVAYDARIEYFLSGLTTLSAGATRSIEESVSIGSSGYFSGTYRARVDHELLRNLILYGQGEYQHNRFEGILRSDDIWAARAGATYLTTRSLVLSAGASYLDRSSSGLFAGESFNEWRGTVSIAYRP